MIRIVFNSGEILDCDDVNRIYVPHEEMDKVIEEIKKEDDNERLPDLGSGEA